MKNLKTIVLAGLMLASATACQKDYYLADLEEAQAQLSALRSEMNRKVSSLESEVSNLESRLFSANNEISGLNTLVDDLHSKIDDLESDLNAGRVENEVANSIIEQLTADLEVLKELLDVTETLSDMLKQQLKETLDKYLIGEISYEDVLDKIAVLEGVRDGYYREISWGYVSISNSVFNNRVASLEEIIERAAYDPYEGRIVEVKNKKIVKEKHEWHAAKDPNWSERWIFNYWDDYNDWYTLKDFYVYDRNYVVLIYTYDTTWGRDGIDYDVEVEAAAVYEVYSEDPNEDIHTPEYVLEVFRDSGLGIYSDDLYSTLDFNNIYDYIRVFKEDAKRHNLNKDYITNKEPDISFNEDDSACARAWTVCDQEKISIAYDIECWGNFPDPPFDPRRIEVMYHELGHTVMQYPHPPLNDGSPSTWNSAGYGYDGYFDIMGYSQIYYLEGDSDWEKYDGYIQTSWDLAVDRFFAGTSHDYYQCSQFKGSGPVIIETGNPDFEKETEHNKN